MEEPVNDVNTRLGCPMMPSVIEEESVRGLPIARTGCPTSSLSESPNFAYGTGTLRSLFAVAEAYPDLKANTNFLELQRELTDTEDKIAYARQFYNSNVGNYNERIATIPSSIIAGMFNFQAAEFYEAEEGAREDVKVSF